MRCPFIDGGSRPQATRPGDPSGLRTPRLPGHCSSAPGGPLALGDVGVPEQEIGSRRPHPTPRSRPRRARSADACLPVRQERELLPNAHSSLGARHGVELPRVHPSDQPIGTSYVQQSPSSGRWNPPRSADKAPRTPPWRGRWRQPDAGLCVALVAISTAATPIQMIVARSKIRSRSRLPVPRASRSHTRRHRSTSLSMGRSSVSCNDSARCAISSSRASRRCSGRATMSLDVAYRSAYRRELMTCLIGNLRRSNGVNPRTGG